ncbi:MAG: NAD+ synthase [Alphaproteobacteria bacterium]
MPARAIEITFAQLNPTVGDIEGNASRMLRVWKEYQRTSDLIVFPELFLCGYPPEDLVLNATFAKSLKDKIEELCALSRDFKGAALIPTAWEENNTIYNAALLIEKGEILHIFYKHKLPNNYVFDEPRTFTPGPMPKPFTFKGYALGIMICEDIWHLEVPSYLKQYGAQILIAINGSPFHIYQEGERRAVACEAVRETGLDLIYLNMIGGQDELVFDGRSFIMQANRKEKYKAPAFEEDIVSIILETDKKNNVILSLNNNKEIKEPLHETGLLYKALVTSVRDYVYKNSFQKILLGLSGGIDSALTAAIATDALGASHIRTIMLPSEFTAKESIEDARACAAMLNVSCETIPINAIVESFEHAIENLSGTAHENTQSRTRSTVLMALSNMTGALLLTTGNKSEVAVGYCTLYGDMSGGFNPLKDIYKTEVYKLAAWRNAQSQVIPERILTKAPTAELRAMQKDEDTLPPYELLDDILRLLIDYDNVNWDSAPSVLKEMRDKCLEHPQTIEKISTMLQNNEHKRFQAAPGTRISIRGFGKDRRYPITNHFVNKIEKS